MDNLTPEERSERMGRVRSKDTNPELRVRRLVHSMGFRYRLHVKDLPGRPDLVFRSRRKVIFVHGCFWHRHRGCSKTRLPKSRDRLPFWRDKFASNVKRDRRDERHLRQAGWEVLVIWECETENPELLRSTVAGFLNT